MARITITPRLSLDESEIEERFTRASGPGGQNVNKVETAVQLRFDLNRSRSLPDDLKARLAHLAGRRLTTGGVIVIDADTHRTREMNRKEALDRLLAMIRSVAVPPRVRRPTRPTRASQQRRLTGKTKRGRIKAMRGRPGAE